MKKIIAIIFALSGFASQASAGSEHVWCSEHGQDAYRVNVERIYDSRCPNGAERDTYLHTYVEGPFIKRHTFLLVECL
jgi:hypothetical protein